MADHGYTEEEFSGRLNVGLWRNVVRLAMAHKRYLIRLMIAAVAMAACDASFTLVTRKVIDNAVAGERSGLLVYAGVYLLLISALCTCIWVFITLAGKCSTGISHDIRKAAFAKLQELEFGYYDQRPVGWLMARVTSDCQRLSGILSWGLVDLVWGPVLAVTISIIMLVLNWRLALIVFVVIPLLLAVSFVFQRILLHSSRAVRKINSQLTAAYNEGIMAVRTTKALVREQSNLDEFGQLSTEMYRTAVRNAVQSSLYLPLILAIGSIGSALSLWLGGQRVMAGLAAGGMTLGTLVAFIRYASQFFDPIHEMARMFTELLAAQAAAERVLGLLATTPAIKDSPEVEAAIAAARDAHATGGTGMLPVNHGRDAHATSEAGRLTRPGLAEDGLPARIERLEFRGVTFAYKAGQPVLRDFNISVAAGQTIALVGPTGGGKTTIVSLLCRFYEPTAGEVLINGVDYRNRGLHWLQSNLGIVLQTPHLFSGTVKENIRYGRLAATDDQIVAAAKLVNAHDFIAAMAKGYDSEVGQGGNRLSTGQKQLVSFARAVLADPQIFVMDEATSSVDTETERLIQRGLAAVLRGRMSFVIAHRLSTIRSADRILVIDAGRVVEQGSHHELIRLGGRYYQLYTNQFTREKEEEILGPTEWGARDEATAVPAAE